MSAAEHVRVWLSRRLTGCGFAASLAGSARSILFSEFPGTTTSTAIDTFLDAAASQHLPAIGVFPAIRGEAQLVDQLRLLAAGSRWSISIEAPEGLDTDDTLVGLRWRTPSGLSSLPMGLGPFATMPVTRRAPHACIAAWPGGHENPYRKKHEPDSVHFLDTWIDPATMTKAKYRARWDKSVKETAVMLEDPPDSASYYRTVAFRLSPAVRDAVKDITAGASG